MLRVRLSRPEFLRYVESRTTRNEPDEQLEKSE
jgi:hypothetical protein